MSKCDTIVYKLKLHLQRKYDLVWSIAQRVSVNVTVISSVDVVGVCIFKVALTVY